MFKKWGISIFLCIYFVKYYGQIETPKIKLSTTYFRGNILPEFGLLDSINETFLQTIEISLMIRTSGKTYWNDIFNYPEYGLALFYTDLGENIVLGEVLGLDYFFKLNLLTTKKTKFYIRSGAGVNYTSKKYDRIDNPLNVSIGSNINVHFNLRLGFNQKLINKIHLNIGGSFDHLSNATTQFPNLGVNYMSIYGGLMSCFGAPYQKVVNDIPEHQQKINFSITSFLGLRHLQYPSDKYYAVPSLSFDLTHHTFRLILLGIGLDGFYDGSVKPRNLFKGAQFEVSHPFLFGAHFIQTLVYNKFSFTLQEGFYLIKHSKVDEKTIYNRIIFNYDLSNKISFKMAFRTYLHDLRYLEPGISFKW
tara:strand:+ start:1660 stop:2745 length:1086 start_codon:yes stop_codon:yes gene_type:complete